MTVRGGKSPQNRRAAALPARGRLVAPPGVTLAAALRTVLPEASWSDLRRLCHTGKVTVSETLVLDPAMRLDGGEPVAWNLGAPHREPRRGPTARVAFEDLHLVVIDKPAGVSSVPYERRETGTALDLVRDAWRAEGRAATRTPLYTVHRLDKETSGLLCFAKTKVGERGLHRIFKQHLAERTYLAVAHGRVRAERIESHLLADRGDGLRGSRRPGKHPAVGGLRAVTHVVPLEHLRDATLCRVTLETGRTHQIRIHLAESGHPLLGEKVYVRDYLRAGNRPLPAPRLLLHAETLGFVHPITGTPLHLESDPPPEFQIALKTLRPRR